MNLKLITRAVDPVCNNAHNIYLRVSMSTKIKKRSPLPTPVHSASALSLNSRLEHSIHTHTTQHTATPSLTNAIQYQLYKQTTEKHNNRSRALGWYCVRIK